MLLGYRKIYKNESSRETANRQLEEVGLGPTGEYALLGVYPVNFKRRSDITICLSTRLRSQQEPRPTRELSRYAWRRVNDLPSRVGSNYRRMLRDFNDGHYTVRWARETGAVVTSRFATTSIPVTVLGRSENPSRARMRIRTSKARQRSHPFATVATAD